MEVIIQPTKEEASVLAARNIARLIHRKPDAVLGLATGGTPVLLYQELIRLHREEGLDFSGVTTFNLDEYLGLGPNHPASYHHFMRENLFDHININQEQVFIPNGLVPGDDIERDCAYYEEEIQRHGGIDLQVLGIGSDGHIGFNEPSSSLCSRTRIKTLTQRTQQDNAAYFGKPEDVPKHVITMGIGTIMEAHEISLLAFGAGKAQAVEMGVEGPVTASVPASALQFHRTVKAFVDEPAAANLKRKDYYRWVYDNKPDWQRI